MKDIIFISNKLNNKLGINSFIKQIYKTCKQKNKKNPKNLLYVRVCTYTNKQESRYFMGTVSLLRSFRYAASYPLKEIDKWHTFLD